MLDKSKRNLFSFFFWKIYLFICTECLYSGKSGCQWQNNNLSFTNFFFSTVNGPYQISGQCLEGERNFFLFFLLSKHFYLDETNKLWLFLSLYGGTLFSAFLTVGYLYWVSPSFKKRKYFVVVVVAYFGKFLLSYFFKKKYF